MARPQDWDDIQALLRVAKPEDLSQAHAALALVMQRGFHRGKQLNAEFDALLHKGV